MNSGKLVQPNPFISRIQSKYRDDIQMKNGIQINIVSTSCQMLHVDQINWRPNNHAKENERILLPASENLTMLQMDNINIFDLICFPKNMAC